MANLTTAKILVIDDDLFIRELYQEILSKNGYQVELAENGQSGLDMLIKSNYNLTLLDMRLPDIDGLTILKKLKDTPQKQNQGPIILLTNSNIDENIKAGLSLGANNFLIKAELTPDQLLIQIKKFISN